MRRRPLFWLFISILCFVGAYYFWRLGNDIAAKKSAPPAPRSAANAPTLPRSNAPVPSAAANAATLPRSNAFPYRLTNTAKTLAQLERSDHAILLENAFMDTERSALGAPASPPAIPPAFRSQTDQGAYIVQPKAPLNDQFRALLRAAGATIVSYIPNNSYLIRAPQSAAQQIESDQQTQSVLPFEPYYKLKSSLLNLAMEDKALPGSGSLNLLLFPDARQGALDAVKNLGLTVMGEENSPFGPVIRVKPTDSTLYAPRSTLDLLSTLANNTGIHEIELVHARVPANDYSRFRVGVATNIFTTNNYLNLSGAGVLVNINDTGVEATAPDLQGRVFGDPISIVDTNGHGTHVAGIIASSGLNSESVSNYLALGYASPPTNFQFRGKAPQARLFSAALNLDVDHYSATFPFPDLFSEAVLQEMAALTNAFISNNSWNYAFDNDYDLAAASYDWAVRDALPLVSGSQPVLFVFSAGNLGNGNDNGAGGLPDSILSPATAKNVITVGAIEQPRNLTNDLFAAMSDSDSQVASYSSRGNVGIHTEGEFGRYKPDVVAPGSFVISTRATSWSGGDTNDPDLFGAISNLDSNLAPYYRIESGTSKAAADVSGVLALMQEFFQFRLGLTNSPALMKALLINGARPLGRPYDFEVTNTINYQGWGVINLTNTIPGGLAAQSSPSNSIFFVDQSPTNALATGQSHTYRVNLSSGAQNQPLRITLAWTDPPGNPLGSKKLVNDLDLIVTNLDSPDQVFVGNNILVGNTANLPWDTNEVANLEDLKDSVNNVENVLLASPLASTYSITVIGHRINVNAVTAHTNDIVQDYALVVSCGNGRITNAMAFTRVANAFDTAPFLTAIPNQFTNNPDISGGNLFHQRVGANSPLVGTNQIPLVPNGFGVITIGETNQWHFYSITNANGFSNAEFLTFSAKNLSVPRMGVRQFDPNNATRQKNLTEPDADIDLYVTTNAALLNLDPFALAGAYKSTGRGGAETIIISNAVPGTYYAGVKAEDQMAADYGFKAEFSLNPFNLTDSQGNPIIPFRELPRFIPDGTPDNPGGISLVEASSAAAGESVLIKRVVVTNTVTHQEFNDLVGTIANGGTIATLNNHSPEHTITNQTFIYDDSGQGDIGGPVRFSDGPGDLHQFTGQHIEPEWTFIMSDNSFNHVGSDDGLTIWVEKARDLTQGFVVCVLPGHCDDNPVEVPLTATSMTITATATNSTVPGFTTIEVCLAPVPGNCQTGGLCTASVLIGTNTSITIDQNSTPPLIPGAIYIVRLSNPGTTATECFFVKATFGFGNEIVPTVTYSTNVYLSLPDDAVVYSGIFISNHFSIRNLDVGMLINHPRVSDLAITLISPNGTRILLFENRGAYSTNGLATSTLTSNGVAGLGLTYTNLIPFYTNDFESSLVGPYAPSAIFQGWNVLSNFVSIIPDYSVPWHSNRFLALGNGSVSNNFPVTNATGYHLSFNITHAPYLMGTVGWWPFDGIYTHVYTNGSVVTNANLQIYTNFQFDVDTPDIFGGHDAILSGDPTNGPGKIGSAYYSDGIATKAVVPRGYDLDLGTHPGGGSFSIEGWINPGLWGTAVVTNSPPAMSDGFENAPENGALYSAGSYVAGSGWYVGSGNVAVLYPNYGFTPPGAADSGRHILDLNGTVAGSIQTNFPTAPGFRYVLNFAYSKDASPAAPGYPNHVSGARIDITGQPPIPFTYSAPNTYTSLNWAHTSFVFTATAPVTTLAFTGTIPPGDYGILLDSISVVQLTNFPAPLVEWNDVTNSIPQGVQFWLGGLPGSNNLSGSLWANIWDTNLAPHVIGFTNAAITNGGWQHVALTYDATNNVGRIYVNGQLALVQVVAPTNFVPRTFGDLYFGFHPPGLENVSCFPGGLDEFGLYNRPLTDCEVLAIFNAGGQGKYGTNVLSCPVGVEVSLLGIPGSPFVFTNIVSWTNGVPWLTNIDFATFPQFAYTNGPITNLTPIVLRPLDPNVVVDTFVLSAWLTNVVDGLFHFDEDPNLVAGEIKFGPTPYGLPNVPPVLVFSNDFESVTSRVYTAGEILPGITNNPIFGQRDWTVTNRVTGTANSITVMSNVAYAVSGSNLVALARGAVECALPTTPGLRYRLTYTLHGPCAVGWWNGDVEPLSQRAQDLIGGNHGAFINAASSTGLTNTPPGPGFIGQHALYFDGEVELPPPFDPDIGGDRDDPGAQIDLGDPSNLRLTNQFTIEGWINPANYGDYLGTEELFFRGDARQCFDPYYLSLEPVYAALPARVLHFHVEDATDLDCGVDLYAYTNLIFPGSWQHIAAVFEPNVIPPDPTSTNRPTPNRLSLYINGNLIATTNTFHAPFRNLDESYSPRVAMGGRGNYLNTLPYRGFMDEMSVYARALTPPEIKAIHAARAAGKFDSSVPPSMSLAQLRVSLNGFPVDTAYGNNSSWGTRSVEFTAPSTNMVLTLESLLPGTLVDMVTLTQIPSDLYYLPEEQSLSELNGEDAYGLWQLEIWDTRVGATNAFFTTSNGLPQLENWQLQFQLPPIVVQDPIYLQHGITYTNTLRPGGVQYFIVPVPQWAAFATNILEATNPISLYFNQTNSPAPVTNPPVAGPASGILSFILASNTVPPLVINQSYYLAVTNANPFDLPFALTVYFDVVPLTNCLAITNFVGPAGIPRYFQFDVPTNNVPGFPPQEVTFWISGANTNMIVVLSEHLPLPDLTYHDYVSTSVGTNDQIVMVLTNTTPFPIQTNRWFVGVFNLNPTNISFVVQACYSTNYPYIIDLTNGVPFGVATNTAQFAAPPGPPQWVFFRFSATNPVAAVLFELYNLSGDGDLLLQREVPSGMAPFFDTSARVGITPEQIVVRSSTDFPDLRQDWFLGIYNNEANYISYTIRATVPDTNGVLVSAQPFNFNISTLPGTRGFLLSWHAVEGETYAIDYSVSISPPNWTEFATTIATTPYPTYEVYAAGFYRIRQVPARYVLRPTLSIRISTINCPPPGPPCVRISWPTSYPGFRLLFTSALGGPLTPVNQPVVVEGTEYVVYDTIGPLPKFYRLVYP